MRLTPDMTAQFLNSHLPELLLILKTLQRESRDINLSAGFQSDLPDLSQALTGLTAALNARDHRQALLDQLVAHQNAGLTLEESLENVYQAYWEVIPYNRIGVALLEDHGQTVRSVWVKSDLPITYLKKGYAAQLTGSSLEIILQTGRPRILNDLRAYLKQKPESVSTRMIVSEGMQSSLTCPLIAESIPLGFIFFSSTQPNTYTDEHVATFQRIARQLSISVEKGQLASQLNAQKAAIEEQNRELQRLNELKNTFLGMAAHNLRSPIGFIQTAAALMSDPESQLSEAERLAFLHDIVIQTRFIVELLDNLLNIHQIESGQIPLNIELIDLYSFLTEIIERHSIIAQPKGTQIVVKDIPAEMVPGDALLLRQVIDNLISNAVKFSPPGSMVQVSVQHKYTGWRVNVQDQGPGITEQDRQSLFQDFARLSARPTGGERSNGLGLAISRRIIEAHGGEIGVDSRPGKGATFWFVLPNHPGQGSQQPK